MLPLTTHQWRDLLSHNNSNPQFCHHKFQWVNPSSQHQCNRSPLLQWPSPKSSSLRRRRIALQRCKSAGCRPFQKKTRLLRPDVQRLRTQTLLRLHALREAAHLKHMFDWNDSDIKILLNMMTTDLETFLKNLI